MYSSSNPLDLLFSPVGLIAVVLGGAWFGLVGSYPMLRWLGLGGALYAASLQKFYDGFREEEWYPLLGPIESMVQNGRLLSIVCLAALVGVSLMGTRSRIAMRPPRLMWPIHAIQVLLLIKMLTGSVSHGFVIQAALVYALLAILGIYGVRSWLAEEKSMKGPAITLTTAAGLFCFFTEWQLRADPVAALLDNGRLIGTCGNPQHAAVLLAACLPGPLYLLAGGQRTGLAVKISMGLLMAAMVHLLFLTGSRTGTAMAVITLVLFFRRRLLFAAATGAVVFAAYSLLLQPEAQDASARLLSLEDTRSHVWEAQWRSFLRNPIFGTPVTGDRLGFGENSWLALMASTGVIGAGLLAWLLVSIVNEGWNLLRRELRAGRPLLHVDFCLAGLLALFAGSFLEAYLLGIITLPILAILTYSAASDRILSQPAAPKRRLVRAPFRGRSRAQGIRIDPA